MNEGAKVRTFIADYLREPPGGGPILDPLWAPGTGHRAPPGATEEVRHAGSVFVKMIPAKTPNSMIVDTMPGSKLKWIEEASKA